MTDNALNYVRATRFRGALGSARHLVTRPYRPQTNGKAERFNRTMLDEWAYLQPYSTNAERIEALWAFLEDYNWRRGHTQPSATAHRRAGSRQQPDWELQLGPPCKRSKSIRPTPSGT